MESPPRDAHGARAPILTLLLASTLPVLAASIVAPVLPAIRHAFAGTRHVDLLARLVLVLPALFIVLGAPVAGQLADQIGRKPLLVGTTVLYALAGSSGAVAPGIVSLLAGRAVLGLAIAGVMTAATTLIADLTSGTARRRLLGEQAAFVGAAGAVTVAAGGAVGELHWRTPFLLYLAALALVPPMLRTLVEPETRGRSGDAVDVGFPVRRVAPAWAAAFLAQAIFYVAPVQLPFRLRELGAPGAHVAGLAIALLMVCYGAAALGATAFAERLGRRAVFALGFGVVGAGYLSLALQSHWAGVLPGLAMAGAGFGFIVPNAIALASEEAPAAVRGRVMGSVTTSLFLGQFLSPIMVAPVARHLGLAATFAAAGIAGLGAAAGLGLGRWGAGATRPV